MGEISQHIIDALNNLSCEEVAEKLGLKVEKHKTLCFMHEDHHPSLTFWGKNRNLWWCFVCNKGGNAIDLVMKYSDLGFVQSCKWLGSQFNIDIGSTIKSDFSNRPILKRKRLFTDRTRPFAKDVAQWILDNNVVTKYAKNFLVDKRHLDLSIIEKLHIVSIDTPRDLIDQMQHVFDKEKLINSGFIAVHNNKMFFRLFTPCLLFPYLDKKGELIGIQSRYLGGKKDAPRFQFVSAQKVRMFNMPILKSMKEGDDLYISEGVTDCLALLSSGKQAVAIPSATILPSNDLIDLLKYTLHMYPDQDNAGREAFVNLRRYFVNHYTILKEEFLPKECKDYSDYYVEKYGNK